MEEGAKPDALYVVRFGIVVLSAGGHDVMTAKRGDLIGENFFCGLSEIQRRKRTATAKTVRCALVLLQSGTDLRHSEQ